MKSKTYEEAKDYIVANWFDGDDNMKNVTDGDEETAVMIRAVEVLNRAIPAIPDDIEVGLERKSHFICSNCGYEVNYEISDDKPIPHYCPYCGQRADITGGLKVKYKSLKKGLKRCEKNDND